jgi:hypothetical protein
MAIEGGNEEAPMVQRTAARRKGVGNCKWRGPLTTGLSVRVDGGGEDELNQRPAPIRAIMSESDPRPFLVLTVLLDSSARPAAVTRSHGDALERAIAASSNHDIAGLDLIELPIAPKTFSTLRSYLKRDNQTVGLYDLFPLAGHVDQAVRKVAGQFLAAEALWALEEQGELGGIPLNLKFDVPEGWDKDPKKLHARLVEAGALDLSQQGIETFKQIKAAWDEQ